MLDAFANLTVTTPGTRVRLTSTQADPTRAIKVYGVLIQARPANTGVIYIGTKNLVGSTFTGVIAMLSASAPSFSASNAMGHDSLNLADLYLDAATGGEGVIVSVIVT
jgi:hypothetical protein